MTKNYNQEVTFVSKEELDPVALYKLSDVTSAEGLDEVLKEVGTVVIDVEVFAILNIHNENSRNKAYSVLVIKDVNGTVYKTGSQSMINKVKEIFDFVTNAKANFESFAIKVFGRPSKNYDGNFITCSLEEIK